MKRSKFLWILVAGYVLILYAVTEVVEATGLFRDARLAAIVFGFLAVAVAAVLLATGAVRFGFKSVDPWFYLVMIAVLLVVAVLNTVQPTNKFHYLAYGVLFFLLYAALGTSCSGVVRYALAFLAIVIVGTIDEVLQWLVTGRADGVEFIHVINDVFAGYLAAGVRLVWERF